MLFEPHTKVLIAHRRLFPEDSERLFFGEVLAYEDGVVKVRGCTFLRDPYRGGLMRKDEVRTKLVSITSGTVLVYELDDSVRLDSLEAETNGMYTRVSDGADFEMDLSEHMVHPHEVAAHPGQVRSVRRG